MVLKKLRQEDFRAVDSSDRDMRGQVYARNCLKYEAIIVFWG